MLKIKPRTRDAILKGLDSVFSIAVLPFSMFMVDTRADSSNPVRNRLFTAALFLAFCLSMLCQGLRRKVHSKPCGWQMMQACVHLMCALLIMVVPSSDIGHPIVTALLAVMLIANRARALAHRHTYRDILFNGTCILLIAAAALLMGISAVIMYMIILNIGHIISLSFSGMDMKILKKVIRKSYATDVLSGLLLMMIAFSFMFPVAEDIGIPTFKDALWYCFAVVTTIGFGDYAAKTTVGRIMSALLGAYGIVVVALITSVVVNFYSEVKTQPDDDDSDLPEET